VNSLSANLQSLLTDIRADLGDDFVATDIVGMDGMSIASQKARSEFNSEMVAANFTMVMKLASKVSEKMDLGAVRENQVNIGSMMIFSRILGSGSFFWLLATTEKATLGMVRALMSEYETRLLGAIPS
jgi:predicted regulator of Ras-like GTPase activity (Roadblock/LC7/MglB family)